MAMRVVLLVSSMGSGGAERVAASLCNAWAERGDRVTLIPTFSGGGAPFYPLADQVDLVYLAGRVNVGSHTSGKRYLARLGALRHLVHAHQPDVVISFLPNVNIAALAATAFTGVPCIIGERSDPSMQPIGAAWRAACALFYRFADVVTVQTAAVATSIHREYGGLREVVVVPNPVPEALLRWQAPLTQSLPKRKTLLSLGRLSDEKQVDQLIECFRLLVPLFPDWDFDIWGDGPERPALQAQIDASDLGLRVQLRGRSETPWQVMAQADVFVMNSRYEGFPNALLEAMAVGLPCVAAACPSGPREISNDGRDALLFTPGDVEGLHQALKRLMASSELRESMGQQARASVLARYSMTAVLRRWDELIATVRRPVP